MRLNAALAFAFALVLHVTPARALTAFDCELWMAQLGGETADLPLATKDRDALLHQLDEASRKDRRLTREESIDSVGKFQTHAATLAREGKVSRTEGQRLHILSETVRRCLERVGEGD
jgi:hypothetical protein